MSNDKETFWAAEREIEAVARKHGLAGVVLLTDGSQGRVCRFCDAPWNTISFDSEKRMTAALGPDEARTKGTVVAFSVLGQMAESVAVEMAADLQEIAKEYRAAQGGIADEQIADSQAETTGAAWGATEPVAASQKPLQAAIETDCRSVETRVPRCRGCGVQGERPGQIGTDNLCVACREKQ